MLTFYMSLILFVSFPEHKVKVTSIAAEKLVPTFLFTEHGLAYLQCSLVDRALDGDSKDLASIPWSATGLLHDLG